MWDDPIVDEIRKIRDAHAEKYQYDLQAIAADLKNQQDAGKRQVVSFAPKKRVVLSKQNQSRIKKERP